MHYRSLLAVLVAGIYLFQEHPLQGDPPTAEIALQARAVAEGIHAASLRQDLSYIASDELRGRDSPSLGLDRAADYIAEQFKKAGLEPGAEGTYFQTASMLVEQPDYNNFALRISSGNQQFVAKAEDVRLRFLAALELNDAPVFKLDLADEALAEHLPASELQGKVVITEYDPKLGVRLRSANAMLRAAKPALLVIIDRKGLTTQGMRPRQLVDPNGANDQARTPRITLTGEAAARFYRALSPADNGARMTVRVPPPHQTTATMRNVIGILRGSDPALRDQCVLLTAHYDHLGEQAGPAGRIYNGANDDGSGTVSVMEVARALARLPQRPRRSIVFATFFGEEEGLIGSQYYVHHPVWPLEKTVAELNLEQLGRTDSTEGPQIADATMTGFDYSDLTTYVQRAGESTGIRVYKHPKNSDAYFADSDNFSFAEAGVPDETLTVAFGFPDYHAVGDTWQKIDYENMAKVDRAVALAMFLVADSDQPVHWNESNPKTAPFVRAGKRRGQE